jgi:CheY-like chemotaxis protein
VTTTATCATLLQAYLGSAGANVSVVANMESARQCFQQSSSIPVLLLDLVEEVGGCGGTADSPDNLAWMENARVVQLVKRGDSSTKPRGIGVLSRPLLYGDLIHGVAMARDRAQVSDGKVHDEMRQSVRFPAPSIEQAMAAGQLILLAEDNETNREVMQEQLRILGYACEMAEDGLIALDKWRSGRYALLLTDCHMPNMDGFELASAIRSAEPEGVHLPIIAVTANAMQGEAQRCIERGMDGYLSKPLRLKELGPMLTKWLPLNAMVSETETEVTSNAVSEAVSLSATAKSAILARPSHSTVVAAAPTAEGNIWDKTVLTSMVGDNPAMHRRLLEKFLLTTKEQVTRIVAASIEDMTTASNVSHSLKSAAHTVGALQLSQLCAALETAGKAKDAALCSELIKQLPETFADAATAIQAHLAL